ncbi:uncharacterized protein RCH25_048765 [Pelodytes ibericus]
MLLAVQKLYIQPSIQKHQEELIIAAQSILLGTLKILQLEDDVDVQRICQAADWVLDCLIFLQTAKSMSHLLTCFREFSEALLLFNNLTERRIIELKDPMHQKHLSGTIEILKKCVPMLYTATRSNITHKQDEQMVASKQYVCDLAVKTVQELKFLLMNGMVNQEHTKKRESFSQQIHSLFGILTNVKPTELLNNGIDFHVGTIVFYSMFVADCSRPKIKQSLVGHCQRILLLRKRLFDKCIGIKEMLPIKMYNELEQICNSIKEALGNLNETLVSALFYLILDNFCNSKDPLKRLLKASLIESRKTDFHRQNTFALKAVHPLLQAFLCHSNQLLKVASLVLAQCSDDRTTKEIQSSTNYLCRIRDEVVSLFAGTNKARCLIQSFDHAQSIYHRWVEATESLLLSFDSMATVHEFIDLTIKEIEENRNSFETLLESQDTKRFHLEVSDLCGLAERVAQVVNRYVGQNNDPIFRNGLRVLVRQLECSVTETKTAMIKCEQSFSCGTAQEIYLEKTKHLLKTLRDVQEGVKGYKHPDLMSPLRTEVHPICQKQLTIDFNETLEPQEDTAQTYQDHSACVGSYEGFLSKPLPLSASPTNETISSSSNVEGRQLSNLHPLVDDLIMAASKFDEKEVNTCCTYLIELAKTYAETAKELISLIEVTESEILIDNEDIETLASYLVQFNNNRNSMAFASMGYLIQSAILLSHRIEETKKNLILLVEFWYHFSYHLFYSPASGDVQTNFVTFSRTMQSIASIVKLITEYFNTTHRVQDCTVVSEKQESLRKIQMKLTKLQVIAQLLLNQGCRASLPCDKAKLEHTCILWSVTNQQLLQSIDEFTEIHTLFIAESVDLTKLNIVESKNVARLCETSLWLQEAATLAVANCKDELGKIGHLKEEIESLTDVILKTRDTVRVSDLPALCLTAESVFQQRELIVKLKLLMYHLRYIYESYQHAMQNVINLVVSSANNSACEKTAIQGNFEQEASLLVKNIKLAKQMLKNTLPLKKYKDFHFLAEHLLFLTNCTLSKARGLVQNKLCWDIFMLNAMILNWSAKSHQLILQLQLCGDLDDRTLAIIKKHVQMTDHPDKVMTLNSVLLENEDLKNSICSVETNVSEYNEVLEIEHKEFVQKEVKSINKHGNDAGYEHKKVCDDKPSTIKDNNITMVCQEMQTIVKQQQVSENWQNEAFKTKSSIIKTNETSIMTKEVDVDSLDREKWNETVPNISEKVLKQTIIEKSNTTPTETEERHSIKDSANQKTEIESEIAPITEPMEVINEQPSTEISRVQDLEKTKAQTTKPNEIQKDPSFEKVHNTSNIDQQVKARLLAQAMVKVTQREKYSVKPLVTFIEGQTRVTAIVEKVNAQPHEEPPRQANRMAKYSLAEEVETWEGENNIVVQVTREMATQMSFMIQYHNRKGPIQNTEQLIASAKCIASHGQTFVKYMQILAKNCIDKRSSAELLCAMEHIQTISSQLSIISSVKAATGCDDSTGEDVLVKNAQNLIHGVLKAWKAAEASCLTVTGNPTYSKEEAEVAIFSTRLRQKLCERSKERAHSDL